MTITINHPKNWQNLLPKRDIFGHKYQAGHALIYGAPALTGATRLAATAAFRIGAGMVSVLCTKETANIYRTSLPAAVMVRDDFNHIPITITARLYGPGGLATPPDFINPLPTVIDADALSHLPRYLYDNYILTPHEGEFAKAFPHINGDRLSKARQAAKETGAIIVLKGPETVIADATGKMTINKIGSPYLATAGSGDILASMITGLLAQKMPPFDAACASVWMHCVIAHKLGEGLIADDIPSLIPNIKAKVRKT